ncbi:MAG: alpha/beta fold hydrolase [Chloroflexaceae bacterium]|jgi:hypothetical protein|nr:alpha/beta fold hydrolase [Chloroflexaceae bacterium]
MLHFISTSLRLLLLLALGYGLLCGALFLLQERLIFFPQRDGPGTRYEFGVPVEEVFISVDGAQLHALHFRAPEAAGVVLYLHGNAGSLRSWGALGPAFVRRGYDVLMVDYRGYGQSSGSISDEAQLHRDMAAVYRWLLERYAEEQVVVYGRSLGSGLAVRLAAENRPRLLILESPYNSLEEIALAQFPFVPPFLLKYPLRSYQWIGQVQCPIVIFHGTNDEVIPFASGQRLATHATAPLTLIAIEGGDHNDLGRFPAYQQGLTEALGR